jgi:YugN-like family
MPFLKGLAAGCLYLQNCCPDGRHCFSGGTKMKFENTGLEELKADLTRLDEVMLEHGLVREGQWDYERVTYDRKFELKEGVFYLRVFGYAAEGDIGSHKAVIQLMTPLLGKHYYPHGIEYGEGESFPKTLVSQCEKILADIQTKVKGFAL